MYTFQLNETFKKKKRFKLGDSDKNIVNTISKGIQEEKWQVFTNPGSLYGPWQSLWMNLWTLTVSMDPASLYGRLFGPSQSLWILRKFDIPISKGVREKNWQSVPWQSLWTLGEFVITISKYDREQRYQCLGTLPVCTDPSKIWYHNQQGGPRTTLPVSRDPDSLYGPLPSARGSENNASLCDSLAVPAPTEALWGDDKSAPPWQNGHAQLNYAIYYQDQIHKYVTQMINIHTEANNLLWLSKWTRRNNCYVRGYVRGCVRGCVRVSIHFAELGGSQRPGVQWIVLKYFKNLHL
jgi:hypothetical protein